MKNIFKYELNNERCEEVLNIPKNFQVLTIQKQQDTLYLWALVDPTSENMKITIHTFGTGWEINNEEGLTYIGTLQSGEYVWHYFWEINEDI